MVPKLICCRSRRRRAAGVRRGPRPGNTFRAELAKWPDHRAMVVEYPGQLTDIRAGLADAGLACGSSWRCRSGRDNSTFAVMLRDLPRPGGWREFLRVSAGRGCRIALQDSMSTLNLRPEHDRMSGSGRQIVGVMRRTSGLTKPLGELCNSLGHNDPAQITADTLTSEAEAA